MKHIILTGSICFLSLFATSCIDSVLETNPSTEYSDPTVWGDPALVEAFVNQIYFRLDEPFQGGRFKACLVVRATLITACRHRTLCRVGVRLAGTEAGMTCIRQSVVAICFSKMWIKFNLVRKS